jgi:threonine 3-dehydrogenase
VCSSDLYQWDEWSQKTIPVPMHVGHEFVGEIAELGKSVQGLFLGEKVSGEGHLVCGHCRSCRAGHRHLCINTKGVGVNRPGCFAEYLALPAENVFPIPAGVTDDEASVLDPFGNAVHTALSFDLVGEDVLITGAGPIGIMAAAVCQHVGARHVVITDVNPDRLELAHKVGVSNTVDVRNRKLADVMKDLGMTEGFDIGLEMSGNPVAFNDMISVLKMGAKVALLGLLPANTAIPWNQVIFKALTLKGIYGREMFETWYKMCAMLQSGLNIKPIITHKLPVSKFEEGFAAMISGKSGKVILDWTKI